MIKEVVNYEDYDGNKREEEHWFNLTKTELIELALDLPDKASESLKQNPENITSEEAASKILKKIGDKGLLKFIKDLVLKSYGVRDDDGRRFSKIDENGRPRWIEFSETLAFEAIMDKFREDDIAASKFVNGVIPASLADQMPDMKQIEAAVNKA